MVFIFQVIQKEEIFPGAFVKRKIIDGIGLDSLLEDMKYVRDRYCYFLECFAYYDGEHLEFFYGKSEGYLSYARSRIDNDKKWSLLWDIIKHYLK